MVNLPVNFGEVIDGRYRIERVLGHGAMGVVAAAQHLRLAQTVAIKFPLVHLALRSDVIGRLLREARATAKIRSEHIARIYDVGVHRGGAYLVMELLSGEDLGRKLRRQGPLAADTAVECVLQACEALAEAHAQGILHRDLKPTNLFLCQHADGSPLVKVIDFGLATSCDSEQHISLTSSGALLGSPPFMAPEQMRDTAQVDARADVFSLGATLFALLGGRPPYPGKSVVEVYAQISAGVPSLRERREDISPGLEAIVQRCLAVSPQQRFADVAELAEALAAFAPSHARIHANRARASLNTATKVSRATCNPLGESDVETMASSTASPSLESGAAEGTAGDPPWTPRPPDASSHRARGWRRGLALAVLGASMLGSLAVLALPKLGYPDRPLAPIAPVVSQPDVPAATRAQVVMHTPSAKVHSPPSPSRSPSPSPQPQPPSSVVEVNRVRRVPVLVFERNPPAPLAVTDAPSDLRPADMDPLADPD